MVEATFDPSAFTAVADFFGEEAKGKSNLLEKSGKEQEQSHSTNNQGTYSNKGSSRHLGVGANLSVDLEGKDDSSSKLNAIFAKGKFKKKKRKRNDWDEDSENGERSVSESDESGAEEEGRTSIAARKVKMDKKVIDGHDKEATDGDVVKEKPKLDEGEPLQKREKKKQKKKGKKERQREQQEKSTEKVSVDNSQTEEQEEDQNNMKQDKYHSFEAHSDEKVPKKSTNKFKKKKVRSKQKNIRKDTRRAMDKPSHLILGRSNYSGRPITPETRAKLNMPKKIKHDISGSMFKVKKNGMIGETEGSTLAIDDLVKINTNTVDAEYALNENGKKAKKKKKKSKYKNLR